MPGKPPDPWDPVEISKPLGLVGALEFTDRILFHVYTQEERWDAKATADDGRFQHVCCSRLGIESSRVQGVSGRGAASESVICKTAQSRRCH